MNIIERNPGKAALVVLGLMLFSEAMVDEMIEFLQVYGMGAVGLAVAFTVLVVGVLTWEEGDDEDQL